MPQSGKLEARVTVRNTGMVKGDEVIQLYIRDVVSSVTRPHMELKAFKRVALDPGCKTIVTFDITLEMLKFSNLSYKKVVEPGTFEVMVGNSSDSLQVLSFRV